MNTSQQELRQAEEYIRKNGELQEALSLSEGDLDSLELHFLGTGEHNRNFWFSRMSGERFVLRINVVSQPFHKDQVSYEFAALTLLKPSGCVPAPLYLDNSRSLIDKGALVISFCDGRELDFDHLRPGDLRCAAQMMANYHAVPILAEENACALHRPKDPLRGLFDECLARFEVYRQSAFEDPRITKWTESFIARAQDMLDTRCDEGDCCHVVNTETLASHFLINDEGVKECCDEGVSNSTSGVFCKSPGHFVDWERPIVGEVAQDLAYFTAPTSTFWDSEYLFPPSGLEDFVEDYWRAVDGRFPRGNFDARFKAFRAMTALRSTTWCCKALLTYQPGGEGYTTEKTAQKLPIYLSDEFMERISRECF